MKRLDLLIVVVIVLIGAALFGYNYQQQQRAQEQADQLRAGIYVDGKYYQEFALTKNEEIIEIETDFGKNILRIHDEGIEMIDADCPDQLCIHFGFKQRVGDMIVCLPNRVHMVIEGNEHDRETDN
ncbi:MAG: NusG domain II-containing protein [Firmicutes bacterium]|nr:NusG domain II-containing protein [Bacillota bacterium]